MKGLGVVFMLITVLLMNVQTSLIEVYVYGSSLPPIDMGAYHNYEELTEELMRLNRTYSSILRVRSIGRSWENRTIWLIHITNFEVDRLKPSILIDGAHHGNEAICLEVCLFYAKYLVEGYFMGEVEGFPSYGYSIRRLVDERNIYIIPLVNPDGHARCPTAEYYADARKNARGVDLNRNYDFYWEEGDGNPHSPVYHGPAPFSELEAKAVRDFVLSHNINIYLSYHSGIEFMLIPWTYSQMPTIEHPLYIKLAEEASIMAGFTPFGLWRLYPAAGSSMDWVYHAKKALSFTVEVYVRRGARSWWEYFNPPGHRITEVAMKYLPLNLYLTDMAGWAPISFSYEVIGEAKLGSQVVLKVAMVNNGLIDISDLRIYVKAPKTLALTSSNLTLAPQIKAGGSLKLTWSFEVKHETLHSIAIAIEAKHLHQRFFEAQIHPPSKLHTLTIHVSGGFGRWRTSSILSLISLPSLETYRQSFVGFYRALKIAKVPEGDYVVVLTNMYNQRIGFKTIKVREGETSITLEASAFDLTVEVNDLKGEPVKNVEVLLCYENDTVVGRAHGPKTDWISLLKGVYKVKILINEEVVKEERVLLNKDQRLVVRVAIREAKVGEKTLIMITMALAVTVAFIAAMKIAEKKRQVKGKEP